MNVDSKCTNILINEAIIRKKKLCIILFNDIVIRMVWTHSYYFKSLALRSSIIPYKVFPMTIYGKNSNSSEILDLKN